MILRMRTGMRPRDGACAVRYSYLYGTRPIICMGSRLICMAHAHFHLQRLTLSKPSVDSEASGSKCFVNTVLASLRCVDVCESGPYFLTPLDLAFLLL